MELTVEKVYQLLDSTEYTEEYLKGRHPQPHFQHHDWTDTIKLMLDSFWPGNRIKNFLKEDKSPLYGGVVNLQEKYKNIIFKDVTEVTFINYYGYVIYQLNKIEKDPVVPKNELDPYNEENWDDDKDNLNLTKKKLRWSAEKFPILFNFLIENRGKIKEMGNPRVNLLLKILINYTFGVANNSNSLIRCDMSSMMELTRNIMLKFEKTFPNHIIYIYTDCFFISAFDEIKEELIKMIEEFELPYEIENHKYFVPMNKKRYFLSDSELKIRGLKTIENLRIYNEKMEEVRRRIRERMQERAEERAVTDQTLESLLEESLFGT